MGYKGATLTRVGSWLLSCCGHAASWFRCLPLEQVAQAADVSQRPQPGSNLCSMDRRRSPATPAGVEQIIRHEFLCAMREKSATCSFGVRIFFSYPKLLQIRHGFANQKKDRETAILPD